MKYLHNKNELVISKKDKKIRLSLLPKAQGCIWTAKGYLEIQGYPSWWSSSKGF